MHRKSWVNLKNIQNGRKYSQIILQQMTNVQGLLSTYKIFEYKTNSLIIKNINTTKYSMYQWALSRLKGAFIDLSSKWINIIISCHFTSVNINCSKKIGFNQWNSGIWWKETNSLLIEMSYSLVFMEKVWTLKKTENRASLWPDIPTSGIYTKNMK